MANHPAVAPEVSPAKVSVGALEVVRANADVVEVVILANPLVALVAVHVVGPAAVLVVALVAAPVVGPAVILTVVLAVALAVALARAVAQIIWVQYVQ
jgi:hypothetical protein